MRLTVRAFAAIALLCAHAAAWADPITVTVALAPYIGGALAAFVASNALTIGFVALLVFGAASSRRKARGQAARARAEANSRLEDRSVTLLQANPPWRVIYGRPGPVGGDIVAIFTTDKTGYRDDGSTYTKPDAYKHLVIVLAAHEIQGVNEAYIEGVPLGTLDGSGWVTGGAFFTSGAPDSRTVSVAGSGSLTVPEPVVTILSAFSTTGVGIDVVYANVTPTLSGGNTIITNPDPSAITVNYTIAHSGSNKAAVRMSTHNGSASQAVDAYLNSVAPTQWTANHRLRGLAYVVVTLDLEDPRFQGGPPQMTFDVSGRLLYDTRTATTAFGSNPALIVRDWLLSPWGYEVASTDVDTAACNAAANACDVPISLTVGAVTTTGQPTYTVNGAFTSADSREAVLEDLVEAMAGFASYGATWLIVAGSWTSPVMDLTDDDLDGQIELVQAGAGMDSLFNGVRGSFINSGKSTPSDFDSYQNATFLAADGRELWQDITLPFTDNKARCRNLARIFTERNRDGQVIRYPAKLKAWPLQVGDRVRVTSAEYGFSTKTYRLTDWQFGTSTAVQLTLQEDAAAIYDLADAASADPAPNTALPDPWTVAELAWLAANSSAATVLYSEGSALVPRVLVSWAAVTDAYVADGSGRIEVLWMRPGGPWRLIVEPGDSTSTYIVGANHGDRLIIEARARNGLGKLGPSSFVGHTVVGAFYAPDIVLALDNAAAAQATADGKIESYYQTSAPGAASEGDIWFDTDDGKRQYRYTSGAWVVAADTRIGDAINDAADAQATADGKITTFVVTSAPTATAVGDLWFDSDDGYKRYRWSGASWVAMTTDTSQLAANAATDVYSTQVASVSVTALSHVPDGRGFRTAIAALTFTPTPGSSTTVDVVVTAVGSMDVTGSGGATAVGNWAISCDAVSWDGWHDIGLLAASGVTNVTQDSSCVRYSVTGNVSLTVGVYGKRLNSTDTVNATNFELRAEVIKR